MNAEREDILDRCIAEVRSGKTQEDALRQYQDAADEIRPLLAIACKLHKLPGPAASVNGLIRTMAKLSAQQTSMKKNAECGRITFLSGPVLARVAAIVLIALFAGWTTMASSAQALPGDLLYPVKLFCEQVRFFLAINEESKADLCLVFAEKRVKELVKKYNNGKGLDKRLLAAMLDEAKMALDSSPGLPESSRGLLHSRVLFLSKFQKHTLEQLEKRASPEEKQDLKGYLDICCRRCCSVQEKLDGPESGSGRIEGE